MRYYPANVDINYFFGIHGADSTLCADFEEASSGASPSLNHPVCGTTPLSNGTWYHAAATYDGTPWFLYLNGVQEATLVVSRPANSVNTAPAALGTSIQSGGVTTQGYFNGTLDEARIWNYARSGAEIRSTINTKITGTQAGLLGRWGLDEGAGSVTHSTAGTTIDGAITGSGWGWIAGAPFNLSFNQPPSQPVLVSPANGAADVSTAPDLSVNVSDLDDANLTVTFYGRPTAGAAGPDFTIIAIPDPQYYASAYPAIYNAQMNWVVSNKNTSNIVYTISLGDNVDTSTDATQWARATTAFDILTTGGVPYGIVAGNHDGAPLATTNFTTNFGARKTSQATYGDRYGASDYDNYYTLFEASGMQFIVVFIEYDDTMTSTSHPVLVWANELLQTYSSRRAIVVSHDMLQSGTSSSFTTQGQTIYNALRGNANLFLMLGGHWDVAGRRTDAYNGNTVYTLRSDYQSVDSQQSGYLRIMRFSPTDSMIHVSTYSPTQAKEYPAATPDPNKFDLAYTMSGTAFQQIGAPQSVASGGKATVNWPGLAEGTEYEWYVTVSDGHATTTGPVWSFITATPGNHAPVLAAIGDKSVDEGSPLSFTASATDEDTGDTWSFSLAAGAPAGASIDPTTGVFIWTPAEAQGPGSYPVTVRATDNHAASDTETITINVNEVNTAPVLANPGNQTSAEGSTVSLQMQTQDPDLPANTLTYSATGLPPDLSINAGSGLIAGTISGATIGVPYNASVTVGDGQATDTENFNWTVTQAAPRPCGDDPALVGCWPMDEGSGTTAADGGALPANNVSFAGSPTWTIGQSGGAIGLNGSFQYGTTLDETSLDIANQITLAAWIKPVAQSANPQDIVKKAVNGSVNGYELSLASTGSSWPNKPFVRFNQVASNDTYRVNATSLFPTDGTWMHVAATYDGTTIRLYINGIEEGSMAASIPILTNNLPLSIGAQSDGTAASRFFQGTLDQVRVYNRALSAEEIAGLVGGSLPPTGLTCTDLNTKPATTTTGEKPQSKVWRYAGAWWAVFPTTASGATSAGTWLWKLNGTTWTEALKLSDRTDVKADVKVAGNLIHALLYNDPDTQLASAQYNAGTGLYEPWSLRAGLSSINLPSSEVATIDIDSTGRMWLATRNNTAPASIVVYHSAPPYTSWSGPITLVSGVSQGDDISVVVALPGKIGVLWANESASVRRFGFRTHLDTEVDPANWTPDEVPASQSADDSLAYPNPDKPEPNRDILAF